MGGTAQALIGYALAMFEGWDDYYLLVGSAASARTRRPFAAYLVRQPDGKIGFQFEAKAGAKGRGNSYPFVLGFAFPLGVAMAAPTGEWAVQKMWAINGAASIAGSVLAAFIGLTLGSPFVIAAALLCYAIAMIAGTVAEAKARRAVPAEPAAGQRTTSLA